MIDKFLVFLIIAITVFAMVFSTFRTFKRGANCSKCRYNSKKKT